MIMSLVSQAHGFKHHTYVTDAKIHVSNANFISILHICPFSIPHLYFDTALESNSLEWSSEYFPPLSASLHLLLISLTAIFIFPIDNLSITAPAPTRELATSHPFTM